MKLPNINYKLQVNETSHNVPESAKVSFQSEGATLKEAVRNFLSQFNNKTRVYDIEDLEEKVIKCVEKKEYTLAVQFAHGLASSNTHKDILIYNPIGQFIICGKPEEIIPIILGQQKAEWQGQARKFECIVTDLNQPQPVPNENEKTA